MTRAHWILRLIEKIEDQSFYDALIAGIAVVAGFFIAVLWWTGN